MSGYFSEHITSNSPCLNTLQMLGYQNIYGRAPEKMQLSLSIESKTMVVNLQIAIPSWTPVTLSQGSPNTIDKHRYLHYNSQL